MRYPSNLISCSHSGPSGGSSTNLVNWGLMQSGDAVASARWLPVNDRVMAHPSVKPQQFSMVRPDHDEGRMPGAGDRGVKGYFGARPSSASPVRSRDAT
jgi:hypothetical protein